jgi:hypothetical protein
MQLNVCSARCCAGGDIAAEAVSKLVRQSILLSLLREVEERAGERRGVFIGIPLSSILSPLVPHGARRRQN